MLSHGAQVQQWGPDMGSNMGSKVGSKNGVQIGGPDFGGLPQMVAPRQFCFDTLDGLGPRSARGPSGGHFSAFSKMGTKSGLFQKRDPKMGSNSCHHYEQLPPRTVL